MSHNLLSSTSLQPQLTRSAIAYHERMERLREQSAIRRMTWSKEDWDHWEEYAATDEARFRSWVKFRGLTLY
jgi:hypothetical protein